MFLGGEIQMNLGSRTIEKIQQFLMQEKQQILIGENHKSIFDEQFNEIHLHTEISDFDKFSYLIWKLELKNLKESIDINNITDILKKRAAFLAGNVKYLLEDLSVLEIDSINTKVQLRSVLPYKEGDMLSYFEILMDGHCKITVERFQQKKGENQREQIPFQLTEEVFERLINDMATSILI